MLSYYREWWKTSFTSARISRQSRYCFISKQSNRCFLHNGVTWFSSIQCLLFLPRFQSAGVAPSQDLPLGWSRQTPSRSPDSQAGWMSGGKFLLLPYPGRNNAMFRSVKKSWCQVGCSGAVGLGPLSYGTAEEHLAALSFWDWCLGWAQYLPASEATQQAGEVSGSPSARQGLTPQTLSEQHLHLSLQQTVPYRTSSQAGTGISELRNFVRTFVAFFVKFLGSV